MQVIVIGGSGHVGSLILGQFHRVGIESASATRPAIDLSRPETFETLPSDALLLDAGSGPRNPPDALIRWALRNGRRLIVTSADFGLYKRLHADQLASGPGSVCLGAGVYPGLSNLLAAEASRRVAGARSIELHLEWSVLSAAGASTVDLMIEALRGKAATRRDGALHQEEPFARRATSFDAWPMALPETLMLPLSLGADEGTTAATLHISLPGALMRLSARALRGEGLGACITRSAATLGLRALRGGLLRAVSSGATMRVRASNDSGQCSLAMQVASAFDAAAAFIALVMVRRVAVREAKRILRSKSSQIVLDFSDDDGVVREDVLWRPDLQRPPRHFVRMCEVAKLGGRGSSFRDVGHWWATTVSLDQEDPDTIWQIFTDEYPNWERRVPARRRQIFIEGAQAAVREEERRP